MQRNIVHRIVCHVCVTEKFEPLTEGFLQPQFQFLTPATVGSTARKGGCSGILRLAVIPLRTWELRAQNWYGSKRHLQQSYSLSADKNRPALIGV